MKGSHKRLQSPVRRLLALLSAALATAVLGPLAAIALAPSAGGGTPAASAATGPGSGGAGLGTGTTRTTGTGAGSSGPGGSSTTTCATATPTNTTATPTNTTIAPTSTTLTTPTTTGATPTTTLTTPTTTGTTPTTTVTTSTTSGTATTGATSPAACATTHTPTTPSATPTTPALPPAPGGNPFAGRGMWVWVMKATDHGNVAAIVSQARAYGVATLMIKSGDGTQMWSQFNAGLVARLHDSHLRVCAWQYVYGRHPVFEAQVGAQAVRDGADCLLIDAESEYEGEYVQAQIYMQTLRKLIGARFPVALAGFPYVDFHPSFPYSVFLGPNGAQFSSPQMYWQLIGTTVTTVYAHTYEFNRLYQRPIVPLGQVFDRPPARAIRQFIGLLHPYGASGVSWWDWQSAAVPQWRAVSGQTPAAPRSAASNQVATLARKAAGDLVVWAQEHLVGAGISTPINGVFGVPTQRAVSEFQTQHGLQPTGVISAATWALLLQKPPVAVTWKSGSRHSSTAAAAWRAHRTAASASRRSGSAPLALPEPLSARMPATRDELAGALGQ